MIPEMTALKLMRAYKQFRHHILQKLQAPTILYRFPFKVNFQQITED